MARRVDRHLAQRISLEGVPDGLPPPAYEYKRIPQGLCFAATAKQKVEVHTLLAVLINTFDDYLLEELFYPSETDYPDMFLELGKHMDDSFKGFIEGKCDEFEEMSISGDDTPIVSVWNRFKILAKPLADQSRISALELTKEALINGGGTNAMIKCAIFKVFLESYLLKHDKLPPNVEFLLQIARNSYSTLLRMASLNIVPIANVEHFLGREGSDFFDPKRFELVERVNRTECITSEMLRIRTDQDVAMHEDFGTSETVGCPVTVDFGRGTFLERLWMRDIENAKVVYQAILRNRDAANVIFKHIESQTVDVHSL